MLRCSLNKTLVIVNNMSVDSNQELLNWRFSAIVQNDTTNAIFINCHYLVFNLLI